MKFTLGILCALAACSASAQTTTIEYQGYVMGGTSSYQPDPPTADQIQNEKLQVSSTTAIFTAELVLSGSVAAHNLAVTGFTINITANAFNGQTFGLSGMLLAQVDGSMTSSNNETCYPRADFNGCITIITNTKKITGAKISLTGSGSHGPSVGILIGGAGDMFDFATEGDASTCSALQAVAADGFYGAPCFAKVRNPTKGIWTVKTQQ